MRQVLTDYMTRLRCLAEHLVLDINLSQHAAPPDGGKVIDMRMGQSCTFLANVLLW